jgi:hypothetical protein
VRHGPPGHIRQRLRGSAIGTPLRGRIAKLIRLLRRRRRAADSAGRPDVAMLDDNIFPVRSRSGITDRAADAGAYRRTDRTSDHCPGSASCGGPGRRAASFSERQTRKNKGQSHA